MENLENKRTGENPEEKKVVTETETTITQTSTKPEEKKVEEKKTVRKKVSAVKQNVEERTNVFWERIPLWAKALIYLGVAILLISLVPSVLGVDTSKSDTGFGCSAPKREKVEVFKQKPVVAEPVEKSAEEKVPAEECVECKTESEQMLEAQEKLLELQRKQIQIIKNNEEIAKNNAYLHPQTKTQNSNVSSRSSNNQQKSRTTSSYSNNNYNRSTSSQTIHDAVRSSSSSTTSTTVQNSSSEDCPNCVIRVWNPDKTKYKDFPWTKDGRRQAIAFCQEYRLDYNGMPNEEDLPG